LRFNHQQLWNMTIHFLGNGFKWVVTINLGIELMTIKEDTIYYSVAVCEQKNQHMTGGYLQRHFELIFLHLPTMLVSLILMMRGKLHTVLPEYPGNRLREANARSNERNVSPHFETRRWRLVHTRWRCEPEHIWASEAPEAGGSCWT